MEIKLINVHPAFLSVGLALIAIIQGLIIYIFGKLERSVNNLDETMKSNTTLLASLNEKSNSHEKSIEELKERTSEVETRTGVVEKELTILKVAHSFNHPNKNEEDQH